MVIDNPERRRLFLALPLSEPVRQGIARFRDRHGHLERPGFRWLPLENLHITLFFLGSVLSEQIDPLCAQIRPRLAAGAPLELVFERFSAQPARQPRMLWAQFRGDAGFARLVYGIAQDCQPYLPAPGRPPKAPIPHITIARAKGFAEPPVLDGAIMLPNLTVPRAELWRSQTGPQGSVYTSLATFDFLA